MNYAIRTFFEYIFSQLSQDKFLYCHYDERAKKCNALLIVRENIPVTSAEADVAN